MQKTANHQKIHHGQQHNLQKFNMTQHYPKTVQTEVRNDIIQKWTTHFRQYHSSPRISAKTTTDPKQGVLIWRFGAKVPDLGAHKLPRDACSSALHRAVNHGGRGRGGVGGGGGRDSERRKLVSARWAHSRLDSRAMPRSQTISAKYSPRPDRPAISLGIRFEEATLICRLQETRDLPFQVPRLGTALSVVRLLRNTARSFALSVIAFPSGVKSTLRVQYENIWGISLFAH